MSVRHIGLVLEHLPASTHLKLVAVILADHCDADGYCWPSYGRLAELSCLSDRTVRRHVAELIESGIVTKVRTGRLIWQEGRAQHISNAYRMNAEALEALPKLRSEVGVTARWHRTRPRRRLSRVTTWPTTTGMSLVPTTRWSTTARVLCQWRPPNRH